MTPEKAQELIRIAILRRPELKHKNYDPAQRIWDDIRTKNFYTGFCYIATEVFCKLVPEATPVGVRTGDTIGHFWAEINGEIWDPTADQFDKPYDYSLGKPTRFKQFSIRAQELLKEVQLVDGTTSLDL